MAKKKQQSKPRGVRITNRRARHDFHIEEVLEAGLALLGTEVKSLRAGQGRIDEAYVRLRDGEAFLVGMDIPVYKQAGPGMNHDPGRDRKLLLHQRQIAQLESHVRQKGRTVVPLAVYFNKRGLAKCELGVAVGKQQYDKRESIRRRDQQRDIQRELRRRR